MAKLTKDFKLYMVKQLINYLGPKLEGLVSTETPRTPQSRLVLRTWERLEAILKKEVETGCFNDKNFSRLLSASKKALVFLCENDKYYKRWFGLLAVVLGEELMKAQEHFTYSEALEMSVRPLGLELTEFERHREALWILHLTGYLLGWELVPAEHIVGIREARAQNMNFTIPSRDPEAYVTMFFPDGAHASFTMFFKERGIGPNVEKRKE